MASDSSVDSSATGDSMASHDSTADAASQPDAMTDTAGNCVNPTSGGACTVGESACNPGNLCCDGMWVCTGGTWTKEYGGCACLVDSGAPDSLAVADSKSVDAADAHVADADAAGNCGPMTCTAGEYCTQSSGGAYNPEVGAQISYGCPTIPAACATTQTCACLSANAAGGSTCSVGSDGLILVQNFYP